MYENLIIKWSRGETWDEKENPNTNERIGITKTYSRKRAKVHPKIKSQIIHDLL
jgi:hypothetical protein